MQTPPVQNRPVATQAQVTEAATKLKKDVASGAESKTLRNDLREFLGANDSFNGVKPGEKHSKSDADKAINTVMNDSSIAPGTTVSSDQQKSLMTLIDKLSDGGPGKPEGDGRGMKGHGKRGSGGETPWSASADQSGSSADTTTKLPGTHET